MSYKLLIIYVIPGYYTRFSFFLYSFPFLLFDSYRFPYLYSSVLPFRGRQRRFLGPLGRSNNVVSKTDCFTTSPELGFRLWVSKFLLPPEGVNRVYLVGLHWFEDNRLLFWIERLVVTHKTRLLLPRLGHIKSAVIENLDKNFFIF